MSSGAGPVQDLQVKNLPPDMVTANMMTGACSPRADYQNSYKKYMKNDSRQQSPLGDLFCFVFLSFDFLLIQQTPPGVSSFLFLKEKIARSSLRKQEGICRNDSEDKFLDAGAKLRRWSTLVNEVRNLLPCTATTAGSL